MDWDFQRCEYREKPAQQVEHHWQKDCREQIADLDLVFSYHVEADREDQHRADARHLRDELVGHPRADEAREQRQAALIHAEREDGQEYALAERGREHDRRDAVDDGLRDEQRGVARKAVLKRADNGHCADADKQRKADEALDKVAVALAFQPVLTENAEVLEMLFDVERLADERAADADEHGAQADALHDGVLKAFGQAVFEQHADRRAGEH